MNEEAIRIAICEHLGWTRQKHGGGAFATIWTLHTPCGEYVCSWFEDESIPMKELPALTLDWLHEVEKTLTQHQRVDYMRVLIPDEDVTPDVGMTNKNGWTICHATALQRAEAFLKVKGLWKDPQ